MVNIRQLFHLLFWSFSILSAGSQMVYDQLAFSGGGSFGALEIGILKRIAEREPIKKYDLYTGISAGALNAAFLSYYNTAYYGAKIAETIYSGLKTRLVYSAFPNTGISLLNTAPLNNTITAVLRGMPLEPQVPTLIGATNLYSGNLDIFAYNNQSYTLEDRVALLMASSAIPVAFPPITFMGSQYADGGTLSNELLDISPTATANTGGNSVYTNITYISSGEEYTYNDMPITNMREMVFRTIDIVRKNFNDPLSILYKTCPNSGLTRGEINHYYVLANYTANYTMLNFDNGRELIDIGYKYAQSTKYMLC